MTSVFKHHCVRDCSCAPAADRSHDNSVLSALQWASGLCPFGECSQEKEQQFWSRLIRRDQTISTLQQPGNLEIINVMLPLPLGFRAAGGGERVITRMYQGVLAERCTAAVLQSVAWSFWLVELCMLGALYFFFFLSFSLIERFQPWFVLCRMASGETRCLTCIFTPFCAVCPPTFLCPFHL